MPLHPLYAAAIKADDAFTDALTAAYPKTWPGDARYWQDERHANHPEVLTAKARAREAGEAWRSHLIKTQTR
jgi:hypothetical protein